MSLPSLIRSADLLENYKPLQSLWLQDSVYPQILAQRLIEPRKNNGYCGRASTVLEKEIKNTHTSDVCLEALRIKIILT